MKKRRDNTAGSDSGAAPTGNSFERADPSDAMSLRILIVSPVRLLRDGLALILKQRPRVHAVDPVATADAALAILDSFKPTLVLLDIAADDGLAAARRLAAAGVHIMGFAARDFEPDVLAYAQAGITGFVPCDASTEDLFDAIDRLANGELLCSPRVAWMMFRHLAAMDATRPRGSGSVPLTAREREIVRCIDEGQSNKEIARELRIGVSTVKNHVHNILDKLRVARRGEAAARLRGADLVRGSTIPDLRRP